MSISPISRVDEFQQLRDYLCLRYGEKEGIRTYTEWLEEMGFNENLSMISQKKLKGAPCRTPLELYIFQQQGMKLKGKTIDELKRRTRQLNTQTAMALEGKALHDFAKKVSDPFGERKHAKEDQFLVEMARLQLEDIKNAENPVVRQQAMKNFSDWMERTKNRRRQMRFHLDKSWKKKLRDV